jgi:hypothetical protein
VSVALPLPLISEEVFELGTNKVIEGRYGARQGVPQISFSKHLVAPNSGIDVRYQGHRRAHTGGVSSNFDFQRH